MLACRYNIRFTLTNGNGLVATPVDLLIVVYEQGSVQAQVGIASGRTVQQTPEEDPQGALQLDHG